MYRYNMLLSALIKARNSYLKDLAPRERLWKGRGMREGKGGDRANGM